MAFSLLVGSIKGASIGRNLFGSFGNKSVSLRISLLQPNNRFRYLAGDAKTAVALDVNGNSESESDRSSSLKQKENTREIFQRLYSLAKPERRLIGASIGTLVATSTISLIFPAALGQILDVSLAVDSPGTWTPYQMAGGLLGLFTLQGGMIVARTSMLNVAGERLVTRFRKTLFNSILTQDMGFFDKTNTGALVNRLSADTQLVQSVITGNVVQGLRCSFLVIGGTCMLFYTSPSLALLSLSVIPPVGIGGRIYGRYIKNRQKEVQDALAATSSVAEEIIANMSTVRQFGAEPLEASKYSARIDQAYRRSCEAGIASAWFEGSVHFAANCSLLTVLAYGGSQVMAGDMTAGSLASFLMYSIYVGFNVSSLSNVYANLMKGVGASSRVFEIIDRPASLESSLTSPEIEHQKVSLPPSFLRSIYEEQENGGSSKLPLGAAFFGLQPGAATEECPRGTYVPLQVGVGPNMQETGRHRLKPTFQGEVKFRNVFFAYPERKEVDILKGLSLHVKPSCSLALVGSSGSGKSTIGALLTRLYDPRSGSIEIDGIDVIQIDPLWLRKNIGVVSQEPILFSGTIEENIRYGNPEASTAEVKEAARTVGALKFIEAFPDGMQTRVGERGTQLSGGQKQRIAVARAIIKNPPIVLLDEATSSLDAESEFHIQKAIDTVLSGRTVISIAHRLSTMRSADHIAVLEDGRIVETGTYEELMGKGNDGKFRQLIKRQLGEDTSWKSNAIIV